MYLQLIFFNNSVDEVFIDAAPYLSYYKMTAHELAMTLVRDVLATVGITATAGIGTNQISIFHDRLYGDR